MAALNSTRTIAGHVFILAEKLDDYRTASLAQAEYWASGVCCRKEVVDGDQKRKPYYAMWVGPVRQRQVRLLPGEIVKRTKGTMLITFTKKKTKVPVVRAPGRRDRRFLG